MNIERRKFLEKAVGICTAGLGRNLLASAAVTAAAAPVAAATANTTIAAVIAVPAVSIYGLGVRAQVFEVIVRQAIAGAPWRSICAGPMEVNGITQAEVEQEMARRFEHNTNRANCVCQSCQKEHRDNAHCICEDCNKLSRARSTFVWNMLRAVPHSEKAPCACVDCREHIRIFLSAVRDKSENIPA